MLRHVKGVRLIVRDGFAESKLDKMAASDKQIKRLQTINGVGPRLAEAVVALRRRGKRTPEKLRHVDGSMTEIPESQRSSELEVCLDLVGRQPELSPGPQVPEQRNGCRRTV